MEPTRRFWAISAVGAALAGLAVLAARPVLLLGAAGIGAVLLTRQFAFVRTVQQFHRTAAIDLSVDQGYVRRDGETLVTVAAEWPGGAPVEFAVDVPLPVIAGAVPDSDRRIHIGQGDVEGTTSFVVSWPVAGRATFEPPTVTVTSYFGLFSEQLQRGPTETVTVEPPQLGTLHVGEGGDAVMTTFGGHRTDRQGTGIDPAELREYHPGDDVSSVDWKATARLAYPHVREYEVETDRRTLLCLDHRQRLATGQPGETQLDYLREVAVTVLGAAQSNTDPLGMYTVGDDGLTSEYDPSTSPEQYREVHKRLHELDVTTGSDGSREDRQHQELTQINRKRQLIADDETAFGRTLEPFLSEPEGYVRRMDSDPLFGTVRHHVLRQGSGNWVMLFTDDSDRARLREVVKLLRDEQNTVVVFLAPDVLFRADGLADVERAYAEYADFEEFRADLAALDGVTAYEVGPSDRLNALLSTRSRR